MSTFNVEGGAGGGGGAPAGGAPAGGTAPAATRVEGGAPGVGPAGGTAPAVGSSGGDPGAGGAPATAAPAAPGAATLAGGAGPEAGATSPPAGKWPENWRTELAAGDKAFEKQLERYDSPAAVAKGLKELRARMDSGELKAPAKPLAENAKPEEIAAWRKENGLPENAQAFVSSVKLSDGMVVGKQDEPLLSSFAEAAMKNGWNQETYNTAVDWYYRMNDQLSAQRDERDADFHTETLTELTGEWGKEFKTNQNAIGNFVNMFPQEFRDQLLLARTPDGRVLGDHPLFLRSALMLIKDINPAATVLPAAAGAGLSGVETRIAEIEGVMRNPKTSDQYWHGPGGAKMQSELRDLYAARDKMKPAA